MMELPLKGGAEHDALTDWRKRLCYTSRSGACRKAKKSYRRRCRRTIKRKIDASCQKFG
jgi:hypothetical protein